MRETELGFPVDVTTTFIVKVAGECNLNCSYCYVYNMGDASWRDRPAVMARPTAARALDRIGEYVDASSPPAAVLVVHGGEPLLAGLGWIEWFLTEARRRMPAKIPVKVALQTNGTLFTKEWLHMLADWGVSVGISIDGPPEWHDQQRVNHAGRGSYREVRRAIGLLVDAADAAPRWGTLTVANPSFSGIDIYRHLVGLGVRRMDFLWPDFHHDERPPWPPGSLAGYYKSLFDAWFEESDGTVDIRWFRSALQLLLGGTPSIDALGPQAITEVVIESDGSIESLDVLRTCGDGFTRAGYNVWAHTINEARSHWLFQACLHSVDLLHDDCQRCPVLSACGGGYLPHRYSRSHGFSNPSVHCSDLLEVLSHIRGRAYGQIVAARRQGSDEFNSDILDQVLRLLAAPLEAQ